MKKLSVIFSILLCFCLTLTSYATELPEETTQPPVMRYLGDADGNGAVVSDDARLILRTAVGLEKVEGVDFFYCDGDSDGTIGAADARIALRTAVGLEEKQSFAFEVTDTKENSCSEEGYVKGRCAVTGKEISIIIKKAPHTPPENICCTGMGNCSVCGETVTAEITHSWAYAYSDGYKQCWYCGIKESFTHYHSFRPDHYCTCGIHARSIFREYMKEYLIKNGTHEGEEYYIDDYVEPFTLALVYNENVNMLHAFCGFAVESNGVIVYYEFIFNFVTSSISANVYTEDVWAASVNGKVDPVKVNEAADGDAISIYSYEAIPGLGDMKGMFRQMMEGAVYEMVHWMNGFAQNVGCTYTEHLFADYIHVR